MAPDDLPVNPVIIVGGGLAGLCATHQCIQNGSNVILIEKQSFLGGNSIKAWTGINGAGTELQLKNNVHDSPSLFEADLLSSAGPNISEETSEKIKLLSAKSQDSINWLTKSFDLHFDKLVNDVSGNSTSRTLSFSKTRVGTELVSKLATKFETLIKESPKRYKLLLNSKMVDLLKNDDSEVIGIACETESSEVIEIYGPIILSTGGYGSDFHSNDSLLPQEVLESKFATAGGSQITGDGHKLIRKYGGELTNLDKLQMKPFGLLSFKDNLHAILVPDSIKKDAILLDKFGSRFCDEINDSPELICTKMVKSQLSHIPIILPKDTKFPFVENFVQNGRMKLVTTSDLIQLTGVSKVKIAWEFTSYNNSRKGNVSFRLMDKDSKESMFYLGFVSPTIFISLGGVKTDSNMKINNMKGSIYAAGEIIGDIHGDNLVVGTSLLACVVFGRIAAANATRDLLTKLSSNIMIKKSKRNQSILRLQQIDSHLNPVKGEENKLDNAEVVQLTIPDKEFTMEEVAKHNTPQDCWIVVKNVVIDCSKFLERHPGGVDVIADLAGQDATSTFQRMHDDHSLINHAPFCIIGRLKNKLPYLEFGDN